MSAFWTNFTRLCYEIGESPNSVAEKIPVSSGTVTNWRNGKQPSPKLLLKVANFFDVPVELLLSDNENIKPTKNPNEYIVGKEMVDLSKLDDDTRKVIVDALRLEHQKAVDAVRIIEYLLFAQEVRDDPK